jgi:hypothetical protein
MDLAMAEPPQQHPGAPRWAALPLPAGSSSPSPSSSASHARLPHQSRTTAPQATRTCCSSRQTQACHAPPAAAAPAAATPALQPAAAGQAPETMPQRRTARLPTAALPTPAAGAPPPALPGPGLAGPTAVQQQAPCQRPASRPCRLAAPAPLAGWHLCHQAPPGRARHPAAAAWCRGHLWSRRPLGWRPGPCRRRGRPQAAALAAHPRPGAAS